MVKNERDISSPAYTITSFSADRSLASNESSAAAIAATVTTLINDLIDQGVISGSVSA
ncbi:hypothetical protein LCGC14_0956360 [marine sediment metagenome]|uniref:Uncharacterized protein n=1 Tax=marine sediment metagenome TaxID=412755 RepID=A0A0F9NFP5_9ZZZZ